MKANGSIPSDSATWRSRTAMARPRVIDAGSAPWVGFPNRAPVHGASSPGERGMPVWTVQIAGGEDETVEAGMLVTESGALVAMSEECSILRAWAPGQWRTVRQVDSVGTFPTGNGKTSENVLVGIPRI